MKTLATRKPMFFGKLLEGPYRQTRSHAPLGLMLTGLAIAVYAIHQLA